MTIKGSLQVTIAIVKRFCPKIF